MSESPANENRTVAVVGGGLAGHTAAAAIREFDGVELVHIYPESPGQTGLWNGLGRVFGPDRQFPGASTGEVGPKQPPDASVVREPRRRFERLLARRTHHPYQLTDATPARLADAVEAWDRLTADLMLRLHDEPVVYPVADGSPVVADAACTAITALALTPETTVRVVEASALTGWSAATLAASLDQIDTLAAETTQAPIIRDIMAGHSVRFAAELDGKEAARTELCDWLEHQPDSCDLVLFPPILGVDLDEHRRWLQTLSGPGVPDIAEGVVERHPIQGWRLDRALRTADPPSVSASVTDCDANAGSVEALRTTAHRRADDRIEVDAVILATGSFAHGSLRTAAPLRETITNAPLYLDGKPLRDPDQRTLAEFTGADPFSDHAVWRLGLGTDRTLRVLDEDAQPVADNLFAAGRVLGGTNRIADGTTFGVDLWTGLRAAEHAAEMLTDDTVEFLTQTD